MSGPTEDPALPEVLAGERREIHDASAGRVSFYVAGPSVDDDSPPPLLLVHSVNAAASAHEVRPLFEALGAGRRVYALDLPGFGFSERSDRDYVPRLMVDALHAVIAEIRTECGDRPVDALAVSLSCEFLARAAVEKPETIRSLALVSSTGFRKNTPEAAEPGSTRGNALVYRAVTLPLLGKALFRTLTRPASIRFFLRKTWGSRDIDEKMFEDSCRMARHPGARYAPFHFLSGYLFSADIATVFDGLTRPVWLSHGVRGDFTDFSRAREFERRPNWRVSVFQTGALPYFEVPLDFLSTYESFLEDVADGRPAGRASDEQATADD